jgi:hypothetical protein
MMHDLVCLAEMRSAVLPAVAQWGAKDLERSIEERERMMKEFMLAHVATKPAWEPPSLERVLKRMSPEDREWVLESQISNG